MHIQEITNSMPCSMSIIKSSLPKPSSCEHIDITAMDVGACRIDQGLDIQISQQHSGVGILFFLCGSAKVVGSGDVCGAITNNLKFLIQILTSWVNEVDLAYIDNFASNFFRLVMDDSSISSWGRDRFKWKPFVMRDFSSEAFQFKCSSVFIKNYSSF